MTFAEVLAQVRELLQSKGRVSYRALKLQFNLDDDYLEGLKDELIEAEHVAADEGGKVLVWTGGATVASSQLSVASSSQPPAPQTPNSEPRTPNSPSSQTLDARLRDSRPDAAERRQLTVLFCDLVGSTTLSEQLDPEEYRAVVRAYQETCTTVIQRYDGHIAQHLGDGILVYFGYPQAHEDDAQRAVRAGLEIVEAIHTLPLPPRTRGLSPLSGPPEPHTLGQQPLQVRIGIHTGLVVVGEIGSSEKREILALGETPNIAARLQGLAEPDTVVISGATYRLVQGLFECQDRGPQELKGISTPLPVYRAVRESEAQSRFEVAVSKGLTPLVGREEELGLLQRRWEQAKAGEGQVVLLSGEPGIGKSRLVQTLKEKVSAEGTTRIEFRCSPYYQNTVWYPVIEHLQRLLQFGREDTAATKLAKLEQGLSAYRLQEVVPLFAALLSLPHPEGYPPLTLSPQKQKQKTQEAVVSWLMEEAEQKAVYCAWEDLHWADPSTLELLGLLLDQVPTARLLVLLTYRPEFSPPWASRSHLAPLALSRLPRTQAEEMVEKVTGGKALPAEVLHQIVRKTDGVPLFVEELTKMVLESGLLTETDGRYALTGPLPPLAIPTTLQDSLMARLDRLGTAREVAQLGATLGREFSYELIQAVSPIGETSLHQALAKLVEAEVLYQRGLPPRARYIFKHALIQDAAYQSLLKSKRQQYHQQIAQVLEKRFPETKETQPELLAHHYTEAGLIEQAIPYWQQAGQRASQRSANVEAISHLTTGLEVLKALPDTPERTQQELALQTTLGPALIATKGYAAPEVEKAYTRARELCQQVGETPQLSSVFLGLAYFYCARAEHKTARELSEQLLSLAQRQQDPLRLLWAHFGLGTCLFVLGEFAPAQEHLEQGIALYDPQKHNPHISSDVNDPEVVCLSYAALVLWLLGYPDQALKRSREALTLAQELSHPHSLARALGLAACFYQLRREWQLTQERAEAAIAVSSEQGFPSEVVWGTMLQGWALAEQGQEKDGIAQIRQGLAGWRATGAAMFTPYYLALLAETYGRDGQAGEGLTVVGEALAIVDKNEERYYEAELYRLRGVLTLQHSKGQSLESEAQREAEECFWKAIEVARRQSAKSLELRAVMSLSRLWQQQGKRDEALQLLAEIYGWFTEGFDTKDLQEAKALLEELSH